VTIQQRGERRLVALQYEALEQLGVGLARIDQALKLPEHRAGTDGGHGCRPL
jgi:hypothetical protein